MKKETTKVRKVIFLADSQIPFQIDLRYVEQFLVDEKPDVVVYMGDMLDMTALLKWSSSGMAAIDWESVREEIRIANQMLDRHQAIFAKFGKPVELHWIHGNHEERLYHWRDTHTEDLRKNRSTVPELVRDLKLKERGMQVHWQNDLFPLGKLWVMHGSDYSTHHARKLLSDYEVNLIYAHVHAPQRHTKVARVTHSPKSAWSIGCLCSRNPEWKNGAPNAWVNGIAEVFIMPNGSFNVYPIDIIRGRFVSPNGKFYGPKIG